jgi:hypothetical protein
VSLLQALSGCRHSTFRPPVPTLPVGVLIVIVTLFLPMHLHNIFVDDIASSVWTLIEENVAIICACLPMMWAPLARLFPSFFSTSQGANSHVSLAVRSSGPNTTSRSRTSWAQLHGRSGETGNSSTNHISDSQNRISEDSTGQILPSGPSRDAEYQDTKGIRMVTEYQVSYSGTKSSSN